MGRLRTEPALAAATGSAPRLPTFLKTEGTPSQYRRGADSDTPSVRSLQQRLSDRTEGVSLIVKSAGVVLASPFISLKVVTLNSITQRQDFCRDTSTTTRMILRIRLSRRLLREATVGYQGVRPTTPQHRHRNICITRGFSSFKPLTGNRFPSMPVGYHGILRQQSRDHPCCDGSDTCEGACQGNFPLNVARDIRGAGLGGSPDELSEIAGGVCYWGSSPAEGRARPESEGSIARADS